MDSKVIALDLGQVCVQVRGELCFAKLGYSPTDVIPQELFGWCDELESGMISEAEFFERFRRFTGSNLDRDTLQDAFCSIIAGAVPGMEELVAQMPHWGLRPIFLSNISAIHLKCVRKVFSGASNNPDGIYSFAVGARKPDPRIYQAFEKRFGRPTLYVDDRLELIVAAQELGWEAELFQGATELEKSLRNRKLVNCN